MHVFGKDVYLTLRVCIKTKPKKCQMMTTTLKE